jgi:hypothetical protein
MPWEPDDKPQLLKHDVQEMVGMQANASQLRQLPAKYGQIWLESFGRNPHDASCVGVAVRSPVGSIVSAVGGRVTPLERFPNAFIGDGQAIHVLWSPGRR